MYRGGRDSRSTLGARRQAQAPDRTFNLSADKDSNSLEDRLSRIQEERDSMGGSGPSHRELPKGLQPISTNPNKVHHQSNNDNNVGKKMMQNTNPHSQDNYHLSNKPDTDNLGGLGNMPGSLDDVFSTEITDLDSYKEDSRPLEARLGDLKRMRDVTIENKEPLPEIILD